MTITQNNYLDLWNLLVNELFGDLGILMIVAIIIIGYLGLRYRLSIEVIVFMLLVVVGGLLSYVYNSFLWIVVLIAIGSIIYSLLPKLMSKK